MRNFYTVVLERMKEYGESFDTEPYEAGWASEAMFFVRIHEMAGTNVRMESSVQVSVDGIEWIDEGTSFPPIAAPGSWFVRVSRFGGWLRLRTRITGKSPRVRTTVHLVLKE
jgi:hypothetical protein